MFSSENSIRVRYAETDRMGYVYYGNYAAYFETGRVEAIRKLGLSYKDMEDTGTILPVLSFQIKYYKPAFFDDTLTIITSVSELPSGTRIYFRYKTLNQDGILLNEGETTHVFVNSQTMRPCAIPEYVLEKLKPFF
jgi:acyl-CoA thioester hydrolase